MEGLSSVSTAPAAAAPHTTGRMFVSIPTGAKQIRSEPIVQYKIGFLKQSSAPEDTMCEPLPPLDLRTLAPLAHTTHVAQLMWQCVCQASTLRTLGTSTFQSVLVVARFCLMCTSFTRSDERSLARIQYCSGIAMYTLFIEIRFICF